MPVAPAPPINVIGLGYVGLPLAVALARRFPVTGLDVSPSRIAELRAGYDRTNEISEAVLRQSSLRLAGSVAECPPADFHIVTVPTPIDAQNRPDLTIVKAAAQSVGTPWRQRKPASTLVLIHWAYASSHARLQVPVTVQSDPSRRCGTAVPARFGPM